MPFRNLDNLCCLHASFGWDSISRWSLLSGVYATGSKIYHTWGGGKCAVIDCYVNYIEMYNWNEGNKPLLHSCVSHKHCHCQIGCKKTEKRCFTLYTTCRKCLQQLFSNLPTQSWIWSMVDSLQTILYNFHLNGYLESVKRDQPGYNDISRS